MIWIPSTDTPTPDDARRAVRRILADYAPTLAQIDDDEITAAIRATLGQWDAADPLIYYYRPGIPKVRIPPHWRVTDCYTSSPPEPDHATDWRTDGPHIRPVSDAVTDPTWRITLPRTIARHITITSINTRALMPGEYTWTPPALLTLTPPKEAAFANTWQTGDWVAVRPYPINQTNPPNHCGLYIAGTNPATLTRQPTPLFTPLTHPNTQPVWITHEMFSSAYQTEWAVATTTLTNITHAHLTGHIAPRAAANIILARTDTKHPAHDWAAWTLAQPWPTDPAESISHGIRTRADWIHDPDPRA